MTDERSAPESAPLGIFRAIKTRDGVARARDMWPYFARNSMGYDTTGSPLFEIRFGDGEWMIAVMDDLSEFTQHAEEVRVAGRP